MKNFNHWLTERTAELRGEEIPDAHAGSEFTASSDAAPIMSMSPEERKEIMDILREKLPRYDDASSTYSCTSSEPVVDFRISNDYLPPAVRLPEVSVTTLYAQHSSALGKWQILVPDVLLADPDNTRIVYNCRYARWILETIEE